MGARRMSTQEVLDAIARERARLERALGALGAQVSTLPVTAEGWTAKDVVGHMNHWAGQIAFGLGAKLEPPEYVTGVSDRASGDEWNARAVVFYRDQPYPQVKARFDQIVEMLVTRRACGPTQR